MNGMKRATYLRRKRKCPFPENQSKASQPYSRPENRSADSHLRRCDTVRANANLSLHSLTQRTNPKPANPTPEKSLAITTLAAAPLHTPQATEEKTLSSLCRFHPSKSRYPFLSSQSQSQFQFRFRFRFRYLIQPASQGSCKSWPTRHSSLLSLRFVGKKKKKKGKLGARHRYSTSAP